MPDDAPSQPSLEPPRLFGRRKKEAAAAPIHAPDDAHVDAPDDAPATFIDTSTPEDADEEARRPAPARRARPTRTRTRPTTPKLPTPASVPGQVAALLSGALVGAALLGLVAVGLRGCRVVQGTDSCGTGPGMVALLVVFVAAVVVGRLLLGLFAVPDPGSTSFLGVGLTSVVALLLFVDVLDTWPMLIVIPAVSAGAYLLSWWVTTTYVEPAR